MKNLIYSKLKLVLISLFFSISTIVLAQPVTEYVLKEKLSFGSIHAIEPVKNYNQGANASSVKVWSYKVQVKADVKDIDLFRHDEVSAEFKVNLKFFDHTSQEIEHLTRIDGDAFVFELNIDKTVAAVTVDLLKETDFYDINDISKIEVRIEDVSNGNSYVDVYLNQIVEYGLDAKEANLSNFSESIRSGSKIVDFHWDNEGVNYSAYEFNLIKVNFDPTTSTTKKDNLLSSDNFIQSNLKTARSVIIEGRKQQFSYAITDGSGDYYWRIRPIGGMKPGGYNNIENYGKWFYGATLKHGPSHDAGFSEFLNRIDFKDPDEDKNWKYSRTYTESGVKEGVTFADDLLNPRQSQVHLNSNNTTLVIQTVKDFAGRPTLVTLPVPVDNYTGTYIEKFATDNNGDPYTAKNFDENSNRLNPNQLNLKGNYYTDNNPDIDIPDANGYPYSRTLYKTDGSGEVDMESGPGKFHKIGSGHETKHEVVGASEKELVTLFGNEAPNPNKVVKKLTTSSDGITSVEYITLDGKTIATSVIVQDYTDVPNLPIDEESSLVDDFSQIISGNVNEDGRLVSRGKFELFQEGVSPIITYYLKGEDAGTNCPFADAYVEYSPVITVKNAAGSTIELIQLPQSDGFASYSFANAADAVEGIYTIEKLIDPFKGMLDASKTTENVNEAVDPIFNLLMKWFNEVECEPSYSTFEDNLEALVAEFELGENATWASSLFNDLPSSFTDNCADYRMRPVKTGDYYTKVYYDLPCNCTQTIKFPFDFPTCITPSNDDFEAYIKEYLNNEKGYDLNNFPERYEDIMLGWHEPGVFNAMVWHMLNDVYDNTNKAFDWVDTRNDETNTVCQEASNAPADLPYKDPYGTANGPSLERFKTAQYTCKDVMSCLDAVLETLPTFKTDDPDLGDDELTIYDNEACMDRFNACCTTYDYTPAQGQVSAECSEIYLDCNEKTTPANMMDEYDEGNGDGDDTHDDHIDEAVDDYNMFFVLKWFVKKKIDKQSKKMREDEEGAVDEYIGAEPQQITPDPDNPEAPSTTQKTVLSIHLVEQFLNCTGYRFAKVLTPFDPYPLEDDIDYGEVYYSDDEIEINKIYASTQFDGSSESREYGLQLRYGINLNDWNNDNAKVLKAQGENGKFLAYKNWQSTEKLFKKFKYIPNPIFAFKYYMHPDIGVYHMLENSVCFDDSHDCYKIDLNGYISMLDGHNTANTIVYHRPVRLPCCLDRQNQKIENANNCYEDPDYANIDVLINDRDSSIYGESLVTLNGHDDYGVDVKYILPMSCSGEKKMCGYNHTHFSSDELLSFYLQISNNVHVREFANETTDTYENDVETVFDNHPPACVSLVNETRWFRHEDFQDLMFYESLKNDLNDIGDIQGGFDPTPITFKDLDGNDVTEISQIEIMTVALIDGCKGKCEDRRDEFRDVIVQALVEGCYVVGECNLDDGNNVIPEEHVEALIDAVVEKCKTKCKFTTYSCKNEYCRAGETPKYVFGVTDLAMNLQFGIYASNFTYEDDNYMDGIAAPYKLTSIVPKAQVQVSSGNYLDLYRILDENPVNYNWYEWVQANQAMWWRPQVNLGSKCSTPEAPWTKGSSHVEKETFLEESKTSRSEYKTNAEYMSTTVN